MRGIAFCSPAWRALPPAAHAARSNLCVRRRSHPRACANAPRGSDADATAGSISSASPSPATPAPAAAEEVVQSSFDAPVPVDTELADAPGSSSAVSATVRTASSTAQALLDDVGANPQYYLNVSGVLLGISLSVVVLSATVVALDSIPVVPDVLRIVGLAYLFWFLAKFLFSSSERARLAGDVDQFVAGVRGGEFRVVQDAHDDTE